MRLATDREVGDHRIGRGVDDDGEVAPVHPVGLGDAGPGPAAGTGGQGNPVRISHPNARSTPGPPEQLSAPPGPPSRRSAPASSRSRPAAAPRSSAAARSARASARRCEPWRSCDAADRTFLGWTRLNFAGGQTGWANPFAFVRAVREFYDGIVVLAGGVSDARSLRAAEVLGCDLAYMGTRFIATAESMAPPAYKQMLVDSGLILIKFWIHVSQKEQEDRFQDRACDPRKRWKLSPIDLKGRERWIEATQYRDQMFTLTSTDEAPWLVVDGDDKEKARLNIIRAILDRVPYEFNKDAFDPIKLPDRPKIEDSDYDEPELEELNLVKDYYAE